MHTWHWHTWNYLPYLTCSILEPWQHGFFSLHFAPRTPEELTPILHPIAQPYRIRQVHGNVVLTPTEMQAIASQMALSLGECPQADAIVTEQAEQAAWVCTADCTPALIGDMQTGQVAAIHAGWRGTALKIVPQAIARMQANGSQLTHLRVALGPAIAGTVYQVSETVAVEVGATIAPINSAQVSEAIATLRQFPNSPVQPDPEPGRARLDVRRVIALQLEQLGLNPEQIAIAPHCTYQEPENFFSYRRTQQKQVQWSGIVSRAFSDQV